MSLPKIQHPLFDITIPSTKEKIKMRPMVVREEKILLMAKFSEDETDIFNAIKQVVNNCIVNDNIDIDKLAIFDLEYLFLKLRCHSVENTVKVKYEDLDDGEIRDFEINLDEVEVRFPENIETKILIDSDTGFTLKYPPAKLYDDKSFMKEEQVEKQIDILVLESVDLIFDGEDVFKASDYKREELNDWVLSLAINDYNKIENFLENSPSIFYEITYTNKEEVEKKIILNKLSDFFMLR